MNDQYTCPVSHIVLINLIARHNNRNDAIRGPRKGLRSIS